MAAVVEIGSLATTSRCMSSTPKQYKGLLWFAGALAIYVLSVGPAKRFSFQTSWSDSVDKIWYPIIALDHTSAQPIYRAYLSIWGLHYMDRIDRK